MTVRELIYACLDLAKASTSDDSFFEESFVFFLCKKYRSFLIKKEQEREKTTQTEAPSSETQQICLDLEKVPAMDGEPCTGGYYLRTTKEVPDLMEGYSPQVYPADYYQGPYITFISKQRMRHVGSNPWLRNIIYVSKAADGHLYLNSSNPEFMYLRQIRMNAVFEDFDKAADLLCDDDCNCKSCDVLDMEFPIRDHLTAPLIELVVQQLVKGDQLPEEKRNNSDEDLTKMMRGNG
jgi:hypothetical protein